MKSNLRWILPLLLLMGGGGVCLAQSTNSGDIRGIVTDTSGALIPDTTVTVLNVDTGVSKDFVTNKDGLYDTSSIVAGRYKLTFKSNGFESFVRGPITVDVGVTNVNAQLKIGAATEQIVVTTDVPLLNTESGDQTATLEASSMAELPNVGGGTGPDWQNFMILLPGATGTPGSAAMSANPGQEVSTNGNLPFTNVLADGASTTLGDSQNANPTVFEDVEELQVSLSSFSAQYGVGGLIINQITKGGSSTFHGSAYEYFQNDALNAANFGFGSKQSVSYLRYDNFGGTISGPVALPKMRKKAFFFFGYDQIINKGVSNGHDTVPTVPVLSGDFTGLPTIYDPTTQTIAKDSNGNPYPIRKSFLQEYGKNAIPQSMIDKVAGNFAKFYPTGKNTEGNFVSGTLLTNGLDQNNWNFSFSSPRPWKRYFGRLDYDITPNNRVTMSDTQGDNGNNGNNQITDCPIACQLGDVDNNNAQITDVWNISPTMINEARIGFTDQLNFFTDSGTNQGLAAKLGWQFGKGDLIPAVNTQNYANIGPATNASYKEFIFDPSDVVTMIKGKHILHFGGEFAIYRLDDTPWGNVNAGTLGFSGQYTENWTVDGGGVATANTSTGWDFADFLLGYSNNWSAKYTPEFGARLKKPQMFVQDDWKLRPNLTVNAGLRYEISHGFNEIKGNEAVFDPTVKNPADGSLGAYWYGSTHANGRDATQADVFSTVLPRVGFSWQPMANTTVRGGYGLYTYNFSRDNYGTGIGDAVASSGGFNDQSNGIYPVTKFDGAGTLFPLGGGAKTPLPYTSASTDPARFNGQSANYNDYHTPIPKIHQWNVGVERQFLSDWVGTVSYVASHGFNLTFPTDLNAVPEDKLSSNDTQFKPYQNFQSIAGNLYEAVSNYNALQAVVTKRLTKGLSFSFNYTWSHMLDDQDSSGWGSHAGAQRVQHASSLTVNQAAKNYGPSNFDVRQAFKGYVVYQLPFGRGKQFLSNNAIADAVAGGWELSGTIIESAGNPFQIVSPGSLYSHASNGGDFIQFPNRAAGVSTSPQGGRSWHNWFNPAAFSEPAAGGFGALGRNPLVGPGLNVVNLSGSKTFAFPWERIKFQLRCDATNAFNHPSFSAIGAGSNGAFPNLGHTTGPGTPFSGIAALSALQGGGRSVQLAGRLTF